MTTKNASARHAFETQLAALVEKFDRHRAEYMRDDYSEAQVRIDFIDPLFEALGWDVHNHAGLGPHARQVVVEQGETKGRPDYNFRLDGRTAFYVEAKAPHVPLDRTDVVMQAKAYAWNSTDVFVAAATDFEEFRLYDATVKPDAKHPDVGLIFAQRYTDYLKPRTLDQLWLLSQEAVRGGSIDRLLKMSSIKQRQRLPVDRAFLDDLTGWREQLAKAVYKAHPDLAVADLNSVVQVFLDRLIFIRIAEDRGILERRGLEDIARAWQHSGKRRSIANDLNALFHEVNGLLNGEIFKPHLAEKIDWDILADRVAGIIAGLYPPVSPYKFDFIGVELLGSIYERYLGKTIRVTAKRAVVEDKPEVRKAGGVYYTPKYIVDYIVEQTVGRLVEGKTPRQIARLRILDPACGSGSFLLGAYQKLLDTHRRYYAERAGKKRPERSPAGAQSKDAQLPLIHTGDDGEYRLSLEEKAAILRNNLYGVDIDPQAVEITMMSLYIKMLEGESGRLLGRGVLPPLGDNIKCGNSLIGHDVREVEGITEEDLDRIKPFDWDSKREGFGDIMEAGGFDAVIGNPPWGATFSNIEVRHFRATYRAAKGSNVDSYALFIESALNRLGPKGLLSFITPDTFLRKDDHLHLRNLLLADSTLIEMIETGPVFSGVRDTWCLVFTALKEQPPSNALIRHRKLSRFIVSAEERLEKFGRSSWDIESVLPQAVWQRRPNMVVAYLASEAEQNLIEKIERNPRLAELSDRFSISRGEEGSKFALQEDQRGNYWMVIPQDVERFAVSAGLRISDNSLTPGKVSSIYEHPKIWVIRIQKMRWKQRIVCGLDKRTNSAGMKTLQSIVSLKDDLVELIYLQSMLASRLMNFWCINYLADDMNQSYLSKLPIRVINFTDPADRARHDKLVSLVERMLELHEQKQSAGSESTRARIEREIAVTDEAIDRLVYELYGLSEEDIKIVEGAS